MQRILTSLHSSVRRQRSWLLAALLVTSLSMLLVLPVNAEPQPVALEEIAAQSQIYYEDLEVESGQVIDGDVVVYSGDVEVQSEGRIAGTLTVYSGDITIEEGGRVDGNITSWSGDVEVNGQVGGSISAMAGNVEIGDTAQIGGGVSVMAGDIEQRAGASVGGNVLNGTELTLPSAADVNVLPWLSAQTAEESSDETQAAESDRWGYSPFGFMLRGLIALLLLGLFVGGAAAVAALRPAWTAELHQGLNRQAALAFAAGLIANVLMLAVIAFLYFTVCLRPPALLLGLGMLALNIAGMASTATEIGGRAGERLSGRWTPTARVALGVLLPGVFIAFLWTLGGCFGFFGALGALLIGSFGVGAILVKALNLGAVAAPGQPAPVQPAPEPQPHAASVAVDVESAPVEPAPTEPTPAESTPTEPAPVESAPVEPAAVEPPAWWQESIAEPTSPAQPPIAPAAPAPSVGNVEMLPMVQDDFSLIEGIGPKLSQRLHAANIRTFVDLASLPPETLAGILGWTSERVLRSGVLDRARRLATE